ncbi:DUF4157 domain-containing protein [Synechococcus sp. PCC 7336]|uniref:eCIS core domain-containing protein n=1 Tax=Synechococcus sp. PCC 7336 TaxID=195250 RepID=UPI0003456F2B|nr:DUF4157 domain-containing protein [Synechococcus sp. PCC 7336]
MKNPDTKPKSASQSRQTTHDPSFFGGDRDSSFFSGDAIAPTAPFFSAASGDGGSVQRMPAFESEQDNSSATQLQRMPAFDSDRDASPPVQLQRQETGPEMQAEESPTEEADNVQAKLNTAGTPPPPSSPDPPRSPLTQTFFQPKLTVGQAGDRFERQADAIADRVVTASDSQPLQKQADAIDRVQTQAITNTNQQVVDKQIEEAIAAAKSGGQPLADGVLAEMEKKFGTSFKSVRIHTDGTAAELSIRLGAKAFTHGKHIFFNTGQYSPDAPDGKRLLAHELTHVLQQGERIATKLLQRSTDTPAGNNTDPETSDPVDLDSQPPKIKLGPLRVPPFKLSSDGGINRAGLYNSHSLFRAQSYARGVIKGETPGQVQKWESAVKPDGIEQKLTAAPFNFDPNKLYGVGFKKAPIKRKKTIGRQSNLDFFRMGTPKNLAKGLLRPFWNREKKFQIHHVDHIVELQVSGWPRTAGAWANEIDNYEMLDGKSNTSSGGTISADIHKRVNEFIKAGGRTQLHKRDRKKGKKGILKNYDITFEGAPMGSLEDPKGKVSRWSKAQVEAGEHIDALLGSSQLSLYDITDPKPPKTSIFSKHTLQNERVMGSSTRFVVYLNAFGGPNAWFSWEDPSTTVKEPQKKRDHEQIKGFYVTEIGFNPKQEGDELGHIWGLPFKHQRDKAKLIGSNPIRLSVKKLPGLEYAGYIDKSGLENLDILLKALSPIQTDGIGFDNQGLVLRGRVSPTVPLIGDASIDIILAGNDLRAEKTFSIGDLSIPSPFSVTGSTLTVALGTNSGLQIAGELFFGIEGVGDGAIRGAGSKDSFALEGEFNFDTELFDPANISVTYQDKKFGMSGVIGIPSGKVKGVKSATITASYAENTFSASGEAELDIPGVEKGSLSVESSERGWEIAGEFSLKQDIPGIKSGSVTAKVAKVAGEKGYQVTAKGTAEADIPGITSSLSVEYDNGALTIEGMASYSRNILSGEIKVGASNRALDDGGQPTGDPTDTFLVFGSGSLTAQLTPWLKGTVGVKFLPNGEMVVSGKLAVPNSIPIFDFDIPKTNVLPIPTVDIPIFAIPVGPKSIGLKASIGGGLDVFASIGAELRGLELGLEYNPAHPEEARVTGGGALAMPVKAGASLFVKAGIGLNAVIGGVDGSLILSGGLELDEVPSLGINIDWSPKSGLAIDALLDVAVQPKFVFTIDGEIEAWFAWWDKTWRWNLARYEYGPDMTFGMTWPMHYQEGEPFNISFSDIEWKTPKINARSFVKGLIKDIRSQRD